MKQMSRNKENNKFGWWLVLFLGLVMVWSLGKGLWEAREGYKRIGEAEKFLRQEEEKKDTLDSEYERVQNDEYIEKTIRDGLNMQRSEEMVVVLPDKEYLGLEDEKNYVEGGKKNWFKWWNLIN